MYATFSVDRRADYYARCAEIIATDPLDFYCRAERGRAWQATNLRREYERSQLLDASPVQPNYEH